MRHLRSVCVFCGSNAGHNPAYLTDAKAMGTALAKADLQLVYGGGNVGLMGAVADAVMAAGGSAIGVIPKFLLEREVGHRDLTELHIVDSMHERKAMMARLSDSFAIMPGGIGTMEEMFEIWTWGQLNLHMKPCAILNSANYYSKICGFLDHMVTEGFMLQEHRDAMMMSDTPDGLISKLMNAPKGLDGLTVSIED